MIVEVFLILLGVSLVLLLTGYAVKEASFSIIGLTFLFVLSSGVLIPDNLEIQTGLNTTTSTYYKYGNNFTGYHWDYDYGEAPNFNPSIINTPEVVFLFHTYDTIEENNIYTNPETTFYGIWLSILAGAGFWFIWRGVRPEGEDL